MRRLSILALGLLVCAAAASGAGADATHFRMGDPSWSPDGGRIAFDARAGEDPPDIYTVALDGTGLRNLTLGDPRSA